jgi:two-component system, chemotaxis family, response regulator Rcp1
VRAGSTVADGVLNGSSVKEMNSMLPGATLNRRGEGVAERHPIEILLVEDDPGDVRLTREALKEGKVRNHLNVAKDGVEALQILRREGAHANAVRPDVILLDLNLPRMDGREVLKAIKSDEKLRRIPVVVLTTSSADEDVLRSYDLQANCFITKPIDLDQFMRVVRTISEFWLEVVRLPPDVGS